MRVWGKPTEYKGIMIHPITMVECQEFYESVRCLMYEKNRSQDIAVIKMNYFNFLFRVMVEEPSIFERLDKLLKLVLRQQEFKFTYDGEHAGLLINGIAIDGSDFDEIKSIILEQNLIEHSEEILDEELEKELREAEEFMARKNGTPATLEERIITLHCLSHIPYDCLESYTIYQFNKTLERFSIIKNFDIYAALYAENGKAKDIDHWLCHIDAKERFADVKMTESEFKGLTADSGIFTTK
jgi:hypothetical protein